MWMLLTIINGHKFTTAVIEFISGAYFQERMVVGDR